MQECAVFAERAANDGSKGMRVMLVHPEGMGKRASRSVSRKHENIAVMDEYVSVTASMCIAKISAVR
jgi:hypothetical protein